MNLRQWVAAIVLIAAFSVLITTMFNSNNWNCQTEDEFVNIDNECMHVDEIIGE